MGDVADRMKIGAFHMALDVYAAALRKNRRLRPGVTIVIVNFNSQHLLRTTIAAIRHFAPQAGIFVVDNDSHDGSRSWIRSAGIPHLLLPNNAWHGRALDLGVLRASTEYVITLDVDAFPISEKFVDTLLGPLRDGATVAGASVGPENAHFGRRYVHPCCLAMRRDRFIEQRHSFVESDDADVGEMITVGEKRPFFIDPTSVRGPGMLGTVFGDVVYHNFYGTRFTNNDRPFIDAVSREEPMEAWTEAVDRYLRPAGVLWDRI